MKGLYVTGWLKRGPSGIIGTNINDAKQTAASVIEDILDDKLDINAERDPIKCIEELQSDKVIHWEDFKAIDDYEKSMGQDSQPVRERVKLLSHEEMMHVVNIRRQK